MSKCDTCYFRWDMSGNSCGRCIHNSTPLKDNYVPQDLKERKELIKEKICPETGDECEYEPADDEPCHQCRIFRKTKEDKQ